MMAAESLAEVVYWLLGVRERHVTYDPLLGRCLRRGDIAETHRLMKVEVRFDQDFGKQVPNTVLECLEYLECESQEDERPVFTALERAYKKALFSGKS